MKFSCERNGKGIISFIGAISICELLVDLYKLVEFLPFDVLLFKPALEERVFLDGDYVSSSNLRLHDGLLESETSFVLLLDDILKFFF